MKVFVWCIIIILSLENLANCFENDSDNLPTILGDFNIDQFIKRYNYPLEEHNVTTEDGYILVLHRIPYGKDNTQTVNRPPVLLTHCLFGTSGVFVMLGPQISLAFQLADIGYDVWLGNNRGNTYSRNHKVLNSTDINYWDFSFHELGYYDSPAMIDYILDYAAHKQISYIGHSQGSSQFFVMASMKPEYNEKINIMAALAPVAYCEYSSHPLLTILKKYYLEIESILLQRNQTELFPHNAVFSSAVGVVCRLPKFKELCAALIFMLSGFDYQELDRSTIPYIGYVYPGGGSLKEGVHYLQNIRTKYFRQYDYGTITNKRIYNSLTPPAYNMSKITAPIALFYSENDLFVSVRDVERLAQELPNVEKHLLKYRLFTHLDYIIAKDLPSLLYSDLIDTLNKINGITTTTTRTTSTTTTTTPTTTTTHNSPSTITSESSGTPNLTTMSPSTHVTDHPNSGNLLKYSLLTITSILIHILFL